MLISVVKCSEVLQCSDVLLVLFIVFYMVVMFCVLLFNSVSYVFLFHIYVFLLTCMLSSVYSLPTGILRLP